MLNKLSVKGRMYLIIIAILLLFVVMAFYTIQTGNNVKDMGLNKVGEIMLVDQKAKLQVAGHSIALSLGNEIKELAKQTAEATLDIKTLIDDVQNTTRTTSDGINRISEVIGGVNETIGSIATAVEEQTATTSEIAQNIAQTSQGIQEVNENVSHSSTVALNITNNVNEVCTASHNISENSQEVENSAHDLLERSKELNTIVGSFKI